jgi:xanthine dehydrogenase accessory factor
MTESFVSSTVSNSVREAITKTLENGSVSVLVTVIQSSQLPVGTKLLVTGAGQTIGDFGDAEVNRAVTAASVDFLRTRSEARLTSLGELYSDVPTQSDVQLMFERIESEPQLVIAGAGHVGASLARLAAVVGFRVTLIDDRAEFVAREQFASPSEQGIELICADSWTDAISMATTSGRGVSMAIVTRGHKQDEDCLRATLAMNPDYIGMIGSKRRTNIVLDKLREEGFADEQLRKVRAPIGLDIGAVSPEEVALAILAEIVAERRGGAGGPLSSWRRA